MANLKDIKTRMVSIRNTQQITSAMKMVAAAKMKKAEMHIVKAKPYAEKLRSIVTNLSQGLESSAHPLLEEREGGKVVILLISSDRGLCGGLNTNLCKALLRYQKEQNFEFVELITLGRKGYEFFSSQGVEIAEAFQSLKDDEMAEALTGKVRELIQQYENGEFNKLILAHNTFKNVLTQEVVLKQVLPIEPPEVEKEDPEEEVQFIFEASKDEILGSILPQYVESQAFTALLDNNACEHAARMTSMDSATKNAGEMLSALQLTYNRARQAAITTELIEIIAGAESL
ncbi:MAG: ATP synthase F1 subunit gamma [SAR324 cluster bacterium]|uniref:ATP synthase gamma chain n=1 Tax=SAR324 cluster bacterium TaxID=2024889 RepID=A0A2A4T4G7_9DELT|nr:MAG: ATP synthase F1 subunit gamma [SAR324 cluster bacterium]